jgi:UDP-N-acetylmuramoyl-tripeptide--D-alanyl-D-alanine ligase
MTILVLESGEHEKFAMKHGVVRRLAEMASRTNAFVRRRIVVNQARLARARNRHTRFIAVSGSSAKTTTCSLLDHILSAFAGTASQYSMNAMPAISRFIRTVGNEFDYAIVEAGIDAPDRMKPMASLIRPHIAVLTIIQMEHKKQMPDLDIIAREKGYLIENMARSGVAFLNEDDERTAGLRQRANGQVITFGRGEASDYRAVNISSSYPDRLSLLVCTSQLKLQLQTQLVGEHFWLPVTVAVAVAHHLGVPPDVIARQIASFEPVVGRCSVVELPDDRHFIMDTFKAPQHSLVQAFEIARTARATRRRIVLGQLSDTSGSSKTAHRRAYRLARDCADEIIFIGDHAHRHNASKEDVDSGKIVNFKEVREAADYLRRTSMPGEFVLLKSNSKLHLERVGIAQNKVVQCWEQSCELKIDCTECGLYGFPFETHFGVQSALSDK